MLKSELTILTEPKGRAIGKPFLVLADEGEEVDGSVISYGSIEYIDLVGKGMNAICIHVSGVVTMISLLDREMMRQHIVACQGYII